MSTCFTKGKKKLATRLVSVVLVTLTVVAHSVRAQSFSCEDGIYTEAGLPKLNCIELVPVPSLRDVRAHVQLHKQSSPFSVAVTREGIHRYDLEFRIEGLPDPSTLGGFNSFIAWVAGPTFHPMQKLGVISNGVTKVGKVDLNKYVILVTAERSADVTEKAGPLVLRGRSPSSMLEPHDIFQIAPIALFDVPGMGMDSTSGHDHSHQTGAREWDLPPHGRHFPMQPGMSGLAPDTPPLSFHVDTTEIPFVTPRRLLTVAHGDTVQLTAGFVRRKLRGRDIVQLGFNGQQPGPILHVKEASTIFVAFKNKVFAPTTIHWHGLRLENEFDGVPGLTQDPVLPGETFLYKIRFPDPGLYWYHPHHREDVLQDMGLYGNMLVKPGDPDYYSPVHREEVLILDDFTISDAGPVPFGRDAVNYALMGRFGNVMLINGEPDYELTVDSAAVVRFFLTNVSNTRTFNLSFGDLPLKVIASDVSRFEREVWAESVVIAPAERIILEVMLDSPGKHHLVNHVNGLIHLTGEFVQEIDTLGVINTTSRPAHPDFERSHNTLRENKAVSADIDKYRSHFDRAPDKSLTLTLRVDSLPPIVQQMMRLDPVYFNPVEWTSSMPMMNWQTTSNQVSWILRDEESAKENMDINWSFRVGEVTKIRLHNDRDAFHAMQHPVHLHGQRFLVVEQDGIRNENMVWKDTAMLPVGSTMDILVDNSNPGKWMLHCHIAEHLEAGMMMMFQVVGTDRLKQSY